MVVSRTPPKKGVLRRRQGVGLMALHINLESGSS